ncbi:thyrostimulin alpha-2 subunit-like [Drosophila ficusphila]|uniref:thyrostimulin alpha-2 subunit-like n=1 Tax=Drosophila ficusphila TaxID=30025 RepID=UPI001C89F717|nr:thyrostimulin alpha-2 subunit-like [Drosophila ficusphila]
MTLVQFFMLLFFYTCFQFGESNSISKDSWLRPGCHKVGNTRKISIPDCVEFTLTTNACRGFCESYSVPSVPWTGASLPVLFKPPKPVISVGQCCNMMKSEEVG